MKGNLKSDGFLELSVKGKIFLYSIFAEKVVPPPRVE